MSDLDKPKRCRWSADRIRALKAIRGPESKEKAAWYVEQGVMTAEDAAVLLRGRKRLEPALPSTVYAVTLAVCHRECHGLSYSRLRRVVEIATGCVVKSENTGSYIHQGKKARRLGVCPYHHPIPPTVRDTLAAELEEYEEEMAVS